MDSKFWGGLLVLCFLGAIAWVLWPTEDKWIPELYPEPANLIYNIEGPVQYSLDDCRTWIRSRANEMRDEDYDYECGKNCRANSSGLLICEETLQ